MQDQAPDIVPTDKLLTEADTRRPGLVGLLLLPPMLALHLVLSAADWIGSRRAPSRQRR